MQPLTFALGAQKIALIYVLSVDRFFSPFETANSDGLFLPRNCAEVPNGVLRVYPASGVGAS